MDDKLGQVFIRVKMDKVTVVLGPLEKRHKKKTVTMFGFAKIRSHQLQIRYQLCCVYFEQAPHETQQESHS